MLSKAAIPLAVLPVFVFALVVFTETVIMMMDSVMLAGSQEGLALLWAHVKFVQLIIAILYASITIVLWHAPLYAWLLFISGWAKRATFVWALLPPLMISVFQRIAFGTDFNSSLIGRRLVGWLTYAFIPLTQADKHADPLASITPGSFLTAPGLWTGLIFAAVFLALTVRLRRNRDVI